MPAERLPYLLARAQDWRAAADALRAAGVREGDPALTVWREAAWCHVQIARGRYEAALFPVRRTVRAVTKTSPVVRSTCRPRTP